MCIMVFYHPIFSVSDLMYLVTMILTCNLSKVIFMQGYFFKSHPLQMDSYSIKMLTTKNVGYNNVYVVH